MNMRNMAVLVVAILMASPTCARDFIVGVGMHLGQQKVNYDIARGLVSALGANGFRDEAYWHRLERQQGKISLGGDLSELDKMIRWGAGRAPILMPLDYGNKFYGGGLPTTDLAREAYGRYVDYIASQYGDLVYGFEIWNEWNIGLGRSEGEPRFGDPLEYFKLVEVAAPIIRSRAPNVRIICGAVADRDTAWIDTVLNAGILSHCDAFSVHPYVFSNGSRAIPKYVFTWVDSIRQKIVSKSQGREIPILISELGWPNHDGAYGHSEADTVAYLVQSYLLAKARPWVGGLWWYELIDSGDDVTNKEHRFGLVRTDYQAKPQFNALAALSPLLVSSDVVSFGKLNSDVYWLRLALDEEHEVSAVWKDSPAPQAISLSFNGSVPLTILGAPPSVEGGELRLTVSHMPIVLKHVKDSVGCPNLDDCLSFPQPPQFIAPLLSDAKP